MASDGKERDEKGLWKKGQSGNPGGAVKIPEHIRKARNLNAIEVVKAFNELVIMTATEVEAFLETDPPMLYRMIAGCLQSAANGDHRAMEVIFDRMIGKVKDVIEIQDYKLVLVHHDGTPVGTLGRRPRNESVQIPQVPKPSLESTRNSDDS